MCANSAGEHARGVSVHRLGKILTKVPAVPSNASLCSRLLKVQLTMASHAEMEQIEEDDYISENDLDFDDRSATAESTDESEENDIRPKKRRRLSEEGRVGLGMEDCEFDSGDEAMIELGRKQIERARSKRMGKEESKQKKKTKSQAAEDSHEDEFDAVDEDRETGGFIRTRGMKLQRYDG